MKKLLFKITGIITWGQSKLVTTINGAFGCFYGVLQTLEGVGLHSLVLGLAHCTPSNVDALVTFDNLPEKKRMDLVRLWSDHYVARPPRRAVPRKIRFTLRLCPLNTEIFSKRRKIYSICVESMRCWDLSNIHAECLFKMKRHYWVKVDYRFKNLDKKCSSLNKLTNFSMTAHSYRFSAFWLRSKCSICSYQLNIWYEGHVPSSILNWFL